MFPPLLVASKIAVVPAKVIAFVEDPSDIACPAVRTVPAKVTAGAVAVNPPVKVKTSPAASPKVTVPVFEKVAALVTELLAPVKDTL